MAKVEYEPGDRVRILVGGPHENLGRTATVSRVQKRDSAVVIYFDDQDEDEWLYWPFELSRD